MGHKQITDNDRFQISVLHNEGVSNGRIAKIIGKDRSSIGRELSRNAGKAGYRPEQAHIKAKRRCSINARIIEPSLWLQVAEKLREGWSPEQISSTFKTQEIGKISHQAIYRYVRDDKHKGGDLWRCLRCKKNVVKSTAV
jgi:IS30 family transposase